MKFKVRMVFEWTENFDKYDAAAIEDYSYAPGYPPKALWRRINLAYWKKHPEPEDGSLKSVTVKTV